MGIGKVQRQSIVSLTWQIAITFIGFLSTMYFAHVVGANELGAYFLFITYFSIIGLVTDGGFGEAAIKRISEGDEPDAYYSAFVVIRTLSVIAALVLLINFRSLFVDLDSAGTFTWLIVALIVSILSGGVSSGMAGSGKIGILATAGFIENVSRILLQVVTVYLGYKLAGLAGGFVTGMFVGTLIQLRFFDLQFVRFEWRHVKNLAIFSFWSFLISGGMMVFSFADTIMIGYYLKNADVGVYRTAMQFSLMAAFTMNALRSTLWPKVSRWGKTGEKGLIEESLSRAFTYSLLLAVPIFAGGILLGDKLLYFFYGAEFAYGYTTFVILLIVQIVNIFHYFFITYISALDKLKSLFKITVVAVVANIALNIILIPMIGISGAAIATLLTMTLNAFLVKCLLSRIMKIRLEHNSIWYILKASILMSLLVGFYRLIIPLSTWWLTIIPVILGGVIYVILILKFDSKIYDELKGIMTQMNVQWPNLL
jgi:O-antigen/teichoic acid export membrane protein